MASSGARLGGGFGRCRVIELGQQWRTRGAGRCCARAEEREREWRGANGRGGGGGHGWALLVVDQDVSRPAHARHAAAEPYRLATAARRGRSSHVDAGAGAGRGMARSRARPALASGPEARRRPASTPFSLFHFF